MKRQRREQTIFFPWERRGGLFYPRGIFFRARPFAAAAVMILVLVLLGIRERRRVGIRATRATIGVVSAAVDAYRADHERKCPPTLATLVTGGYLSPETAGPPPSDGSARGQTPIDAWGRPLRLICPGMRNREGYDLMSDGPDGEIGGLDRVE